MILIKVTTDKKTGEQISHFKDATTGRKIRFFGPVTAKAQGMRRLAEFGIATMITRVQRAIGSDDQPMKPLKRGYAIAKTKAGKGNRRNLTLSGAMLGNISVRSVSERQARIDITSTQERMKARVNERRSPWYGWSQNDLAAMSDYAHSLWQSGLAATGFLPQGAGRRRSLPVWMNPLNRPSPSGYLA